MIVLCFREMLVFTSPYSNTKLSANQQDEISQQTTFNPAFGLSRRDDLLINKEGEIRKGLPLQHTTNSVTANPVSILKTNK